MWVAIAYRRCVLPSPTPPYTNSGLYAFEGGASATAMAAAWANRLDDPRTKFSKVYLVGRAGAEGAESCRPRLGGIMFLAGGSVRSPRVRVPSSTSSSRPLTWPTSLVISSR